jgi:hypothetical protein
MFPVPGLSRLLKYLLILPAQPRQACPAQAFDFQQYRVVHEFVFLSLTVNHSRMNVLRGPAGK